MKFFIGIPTLNRADLLHESLDDIAKNLKDIHHLFIIDNGNQDIVIPDLLCKKTTIKRAGTNLGVAGSWNYLIDRFMDSSADHLLIINDDIVLGKTSADLESIINKYPSYSIVVGTQNWCSFFISRSAVTTVGKFDETFYPAYYEDNDYAYRLALKNIPHVSDSSCNPRLYRNSMTIQKDSTLNKSFSSLGTYYKKKWGGMPLFEKYTEPFGGIDTHYAQLCRTPSDINEHLPTLYKYTTLVEHVTEFGVRHGVSTVALLKGCPKTLKIYDIDKKEQDANVLKAYSLELGINFTFEEADTLQIKIDQTDLLFIDTWHVYQQLKKELEMHHAKVNKYIILHDTTSFETRGEDKTSVGLWPAVEEFILNFPEWSILERYNNNNGLTILIKK